MSLSSGDFLVDFGLGIGTQITLAILIFIFIYFTTLKILFNSYSISKILRNYKIKEKIKNEYSKLFITREGLLYHIGKSHSLGEIEEVKIMLKELENLDEKINKIEENNDYFI